MASQGVRFARREQRLYALPPRVRNTPIRVGFLVVVMPQCGSERRACSLQDTSKTAYVETVQTPPFDNPEVQRAVYLVIDRQEIFARGYEGSGTPRVILDPQLFP